MLKIHPRLQPFLAVIGVLSTGFVAVNAAAVVNYPGPFVGTTVTYTDVEESSADPIEDPEPLFGAPTVLAGDTLDFNPSANAFAATSPPPDNTDGALSFVVTSNGGGNIPGLIIRESGDYQFLGGTSNTEVVSATTFVRVLDIATDALLASGTSSFSETFDNTPIEGGFWNNVVSIDLTGVNKSSVKVVLNNLLQASGSDSATAFIRKKEFQVDVPEPGSLALAATGMLLLARRRR